MYTVLKQLALVLFAFVSLSFAQELDFDFPSDEPVIKETPKKKVSKESSTDDEVDSVEINEDSLALVNSFNELKNKLDSLENKQENVNINMNNLNELGMNLDGKMTEVDNSIQEVMAKVDKLLEKDTVKVDKAKLFLGQWSLRFDEGLGARVYVTDAIGIYASAGYRLFTADSAHHQKLNDFMAKVGVNYCFMSFTRLRLHALLEYKFDLVQDETFPKQNMLSFTRYNVMHHHIRLALCPEVFVTPNFSLSYKFGIESTFWGASSKLKKDRTDTESKENDYFEIGVLGFGKDFLEQLRSNFAINVYFKTRK